MITNKALYTAYLFILHLTNYPKTFALLDGLSKVMTTTLSSSMHSVVRFEVQRARALGYYMQKQYDLAIKELVACLKKCPKVNGNYIDAYTDALLLLSHIHIKQAR
ncbi:hypothetical protein EON65_54680 [archaeon]|nr:MAG: hypothetical protein EON65_54680 [archaeon]